MSVYPAPMRLFSAISTICEHETFWFFYGIDYGVLDLWSNFGLYIYVLAGVLSFPVWLILPLLHHFVCRVNCLFLLGRASQPRGRVHLAAHGPKRRPGSTTSPISRLTLTH